MILWRMDDLNFSGTMEGRPLPVSGLERLLSLFDERRLRLNWSLITRYHGQSWHDNPGVFQFVKRCVSNGHKILAHGFLHDKSRSYTDMRDEEILAEMEGQKQNFGEMDLPFDWFCYPFNHRNERTNRLVTGYGIKIVQEEFSTWKRLSTVTTWRAPQLSEKKLDNIIHMAFEGNDSMVEDHCWFYNDDRDFKILKKTLDILGSIPFITVDMLQAVRN
jgi:hypothetical protein